MMRTRRPWFVLRPGHPTAHIFGRAGSTVCGRPLGQDSTQQRERPTMVCRWCLTGWRSLTDTVSIPGLDAHGRLA